MFSIYTSLYNLNNGFIDWKQAIINFSDFADEVCISTLTADMETLGNFLCNFAPSHKCDIKAVPCHVSLEDASFDGKLKNMALKSCTEAFCLSLDGDERISIKDKPSFESVARYLNDKSIDAAMIPVIDLFNSDREYKSIGFKWYLHKNLPNISRGIVNFAKKDNGKIDINRSDTCELIYDNGDLVYSYYLISPQTSDSDKLYTIKSVNCPVIYHLGWLDKEKRLKSNAFWQPIWENRAGMEVKNIIHSKDKLNQIEYFPHGLKLWYE